MNRPLTIQDAPMFKRVMEDPVLCKGVLECILGIEIDRIEYQNTEQEISSSIDARGVRLDAYVKATGQVFDIEMQCARYPALGKRMRYYQAAVDSVLVDKGDMFEDIDESFIIFICAHDHYNKGLPVYHIERACQEDPTISIGDESHWVVLNSTAWAKDDDKTRSNLLQFVQKGTASDALTQGLAQAVREANDDAEWRKNAMGLITLEERMRLNMTGARAEGRAEGMEQGKAEGIEQGKAEGEERYSKLIDILLGEQRIDDLKRAADDAVYRQELFQEYGL